ncbi:MAG: RNA methyltransferase [Proteobacteria bacterium]|nr:RNA methyltransferase [Pseudomonadota bacterium]
MNDETKPPVDIESVANPRVKSWAALARRSERDRSGRFIVEGHREAVRAARLLTIAESVVCPEYAQSPPDLPNMVTVSMRVFDKLSHRQHPDGVLVVAIAPHFSLDAFSPAEPALVLVADGLEKPGNIGAILRTCDAMGASFIGSSLATDITNPNVVRSAQGSLFSTNIAVTSREAALAWCTQHTSVVVAHPDPMAKILWDLDLTRPTSLVIGSEHAGVDHAWLGAGTPTVVPMQGSADSLNTSVAAALFISEANRQRR